MALIFTIYLQIRDYPAALEEIARVLRPGGLFLSCEWNRHMAFHPELQQVPSVDAPAAVRFMDAITDALASRGIQPIADQIPTFLEDSGYFTQITVGKKYIPLGDWPSDLAFKSIGADCLKMHERYADSCKPLLLEVGWGEVASERLITDYIEEICSVSGLVDIIFTVHARRI